MKLSILNSNFAVCRLNPNSSIPNWAISGAFSSVSRTEEELSIVCDQSVVPEEVKCEKNWKMFKVEGPLDFNLTGILASILNPLAESKISIFAISTFDTDYIMVKTPNLETACAALRSSGFTLD